MAKKYKVTNVAGSVEINGKVYHPGDELTASDFRPASGKKYEDWEDYGDKTPGVKVMRDSPSELDSLLASGHVEAA